MKKEFDIYEELNIENDIKQDREWDYIYHDSPRLQYDIDSDTIIRIEFCGYDKFSCDSKSSKKDRKGIIVQMIKFSDDNYHRDETIFSKRIYQFSKKYYLVRKIRNILLENNYIREEGEKKERLRIGKINRENNRKARQAEYEENMSRIPEHYLREKMIDKILED